MNALVHKCAYAALLDDHLADITEDQYFLYAMPEAMQNHNTIQTLPQGSKDCNVIGYIEPALLRVQKNIRKLR